LDAARSGLVYVKPDLSPGTGRVRSARADQPVKVCIEVNRRCFGRGVVVKVLRQRHDDVAQQRFMQGAQLASRVSSKERAIAETEHRVHVRGQRSRCVHSRPHIDAEVSSSSDDPVRL